MPDPLHPALVHLPLGLALVMPLVAAGVALAVARRWCPPRAWIAVVALQALLVAGGVAALVTGERDGERVERIAGEAPVETHEERAEAFLVSAVVALATAAAALVAPRFAGGLMGFSLTFMLVAAVQGVRAGKAGGELVYRHGAARAFSAGAEGAPPPAEDPGRGRERRGRDRER